MLPTSAKDILKAGATSLLTAIFVVTIMGMHLSMEKSKFFVKLEARNKVINTV